MESNKEPNKKSSPLNALKVGGILFASPAILSYNLFVKPLIRQLNKNKSINWDKEWNSYTKEYNNLERRNELDECLKLTKEFNQIILQLLGENHLRFAMIQGMLGATENFLGNIVSAKAHLETSVRVFRMNKVTNDNTYITSLVYLGIINWKSYNPKEAEQLLLEAYEIMINEGKKEDELFEHLLSVIANLYYGVNNYKRGEEFYGRLSSTNKVTLDNYGCKISRAVSLIYRERNKEAVDELKKVLSFLENEMPNSGDYYLAQSIYIDASIESSTKEEIIKHLEVLEKGFTQHPKFNPQHMDVIYSNMAHIYYKIGDYKTAIDVVNRFGNEDDSVKADLKISCDLVFIQAIAYEKLNDFNNAAKNYKTALEKMVDLFLQNLILFDPNEKYQYINSYHKHIYNVANFIREHSQEYPELVLAFFENRIKTKNVLYNDYSNIQKLYNSYKHFSEQLKKDEVYIEIMRADEDSDTRNVSYLFFLVKSISNEFPELIVISGNDLEKKDFTPLLNSMENKSTNLLSYKKYWKLIDEKISDEKKVYYSPDGIYRFLNPEILSKTFSSQLINEKEFICCNSITQIVERNNLVNIKDAVLVGDPEFIDRNEKVEEYLKGIGLLPIPETKNEVELISSYLENNSIESDLLIGKFATKENLLSKFSKNLVHIATHGIQFNYKSLERIEDIFQNSGLLLANSLVKEKEEVAPNFEGIITADEVLYADLSKVEITLLSSCNSGIGKMSHIGDSFGFPFALFSAGCKFVLVSLWHIDDKVTNKFFQLFYTELLASKDPILSLRNTKLKMREEYKHPYYWGGFVVISR